MKTTDPSPRLDGVEVAITGRLASMPRSEAKRRIDAAGGRFVEAPGEVTARLVVGENGPLLGEDGRMTRHLRTARELQARGHAIRIVAEAEFLEEIGLDDRSEELRRLFTTAQLARILGVSGGQVRAWVRHGLIKPVRVVHRLAWFDFQQVAAAKTLSQLAREGVSIARLRKSLEQLHAWLPAAEGSLAQLEAIEQGGPVLVRLADGSLAEPSGQLRFDFDAGEEAPDEGRVSRVRSAQDWFDEGVRAEEAGDIDRAEISYRSAAEQPDATAEMHFNFGNTLLALDRPDEALEPLRIATRMERHYVEAWNNLGNVLDALDRRAEAIVAYRRALKIAPDYADAHYNLAESLEVVGNTEHAIEHWRAYLENDPHSSWASEVRKRLRKLGAD